MMGKCNKNALSIMVLICINTMDSIMGAIIGPTLIFYIYDLGGDNAILGWMSTVSTISSMIMISVYGKWVDTNGNKYRQPYLFSFTFGIIQSLMYFVAILFPKGPIALGVLLLSQFFAGIAGSGRTLAYTWVASAIPQDQQRNVLTLMSSSRTLGMVLGPLSNMLVSEIDTSITLFGLTIPLNPYNSIGLLIACGEIILMVVMLLFLEEPPEKEKEVEVEKSKQVEVVTEEKGILYALSHFDIVLPIFTIFAMVCCFLLPGLCLPPVARNLGWDTVEISTVSSVGSVLMAIAMALSACVSMSSIPDAGLIIGGECGFIIGGLITYIWWTDNINYWELALPMFCIMFSYPFIGPANRSKFTRAVHDKKELHGCQGVLMGVMQQAAALPSLILPPLITTYILRDQDDIDASTDKHQLTIGALYVPIICSMVILGIMYEYLFMGKKGSEEEDDEEGDVFVDETSTLLDKKDRKQRRSSLTEINDSTSVTSSVRRRMSVEIEIPFFGDIPNPVETKYEKELMDKLTHDQEEWEEEE